MTGASRTPRPERAGASRIGVLGNVEHCGMGPLLERLHRAAADAGLELYLDRDLRERWSPGDRALEEGWGRVDCLLTLGGDGTFLRGARLAAPRGVPVLGCNLGRLGFLTMIRQEGLEEALGRLVRGEFRAEERVAMEVTVSRAGGGSHAAASRIGTSPAGTSPAGTSPPGTSFFSVNDAVIHNSGFARLIRLRVWAEGEEVAQYSADGIILSTATGSTAYSLSAGGPILVPTLDALLATPISPHTLAVRPVVFSGDTRISVEVLSDGEDIVLTVDGQSGSGLAAGDRVEVARSEHPLRLLRLPGHSFFSVLRRKLRWGDVRPRGTERVEGRG